MRARSQGGDGAGPRCGRNIRGLILAVVFVLVAVVCAKADNDLVVHEWGTFTSLQAGDGQLLMWKTLVKSDLPTFVYDWKKPGLNRRATGMFSAKGTTYAFQRMETPVIYFYTARPQTADVLVKFPEGLVTEWYPKAQEIGPSIEVPSAQQISAQAALASMIPTFITNETTNGTAESLVRWKGLQLVPPDSHFSLSAVLPTNSAGSHYYAARETDAALVRIDADATSQWEKFLFYRGLGNFGAPLQATVNKGGNVSMKNTGEETLPRFFVLQVRNGRANFVPLNALEPKQVQSVQIKEDLLPLPQVRAQIAAEMEMALSQEGLYPREARAMVRTWEDSWFSEEGLRVLYILPRRWTDRTLPLQITPKPRETVRVMVGRAELVVPGTEERLMKLMATATSNTEARETLNAELKRLGRFAEPVFRLALEKLNVDMNEQGRLAKILYQSASVQ